MILETEVNWIELIQSLDQSELLKDELNEPYSKAALLLPCKWQGGEEV
jgi:hypothetical protein